MHAPSTSSLTLQISQTTNFAQDFSLLWPEAALLCICLVQIALLAFGVPQRRIAWLSAIGLLEVVVLLVQRSSTSTVPVGVFFPLRFDAMAAPFLMLSALSSLFSVLWLASQRALGAGYYSFFLVAGLFGVHVMVLSSEFLLSIVGLEIVSVAMFAAVAWGAGRPALQAGLRFAILGVFSTALMLYGVSWLYGLSGTTQLIFQGSDHIPLQFDGQVQYLVIAALVLAGPIFKLGIFPFQSWVSEVFEQAPLPVLAYISMVPKAGAFILIVRICNFVFPSQDTMLLLATLGSVAMLVGNLGGLFQSNFNRLMAFSSVAHSGFLLLAAFAFPPTVAPFYFATLLAANYGLFLFWDILTSHGATQFLASVSGWGRGIPFLAVVAVLLALSLSGLPPTIGFLAKYQLILGLIHPQSTPPLSVLAALILVNSAISIAFYLKIPYALLFPKLVSPAPALHLVQYAVGSVIALAVLGLFFYPIPLQAIAAWGQSATSAPLLAW